MKGRLSTSTRSRTALATPTLQLTRSVALPHSHDQRSHKYLNQSGQYTRSFSTSNTSGSDNWIPTSSVSATNSRTRGVEIPLQMQSERVSPSLRIETDVTYSESLKIWIASMIVYDDNRIVYAKMQGHKCHVPDSVENDSAKSFGGKLFAFFRAAVTADTA